MTIEAKLDRILPYVGIGLAPIVLGIALWFLMRGP